MRERVVEPDELGPGGAVRPACKSNAVSLEPGDAELDLQMPTKVEDQGNVATGDD